MRSCNHLLGIVAGLMAGSAGFSLAATGRISDGGSLQTADFDCSETLVAQFIAPTTTQSWQDWAAERAGGAMPKADSAARNGAAAGRGEANHQTDRTAERAGGAMPKADSTARNGAAAGRGKANHQTGRTADTTVQGGTLTEAQVSGRRALESLTPGDAADRTQLGKVSGLSDAVRRFSGVQVKDYGGVGGLKTVNVRSLGSEYTGVYIDGVQVSNAQNMQVDLGRFSADDFEYARLSIAPLTDRPLSAKEYASGNSLSLTTSAPTFRAGRRDSFRLQLRGGSFGTFSPSLSWGRRLSDKLSGTLTLEQTRTDGEYRFHFTGAGYDTTLTRKNSDLSSLRAQLSLFHGGGRLSWRGTAYWYDSERGLPGPVVRRPQDAATTKDRQEDRDFFAQWSGDASLTERWSMSMKVRYAYDYTRYRTNPEEDPQSMPTDVRYELHTAYLSASSAWRLLPWWSVSMAADYEFSLLSSDVREFVWPRRHSVWIAAGNKLRFNNLSIDLNAPVIVALDRFGQNEATAWSASKSSRTALTPCATAVWRPLSGLSVNAFVKRSYRMPSFNDLYYTLIGNSDLDPESAWQFDAGLSHTATFLGVAQSELKADVYYNSVKDKIIAVPTSNQFRWTMYNLGKVRIEGMELRWRLGPAVPVAVQPSLTLRYTFQRARDFSNPVSLSYKGQIPYIPLHSGSADLGLSWRGWDFSASMMACSKRWSTSANLPDYEIAPFCTLDAWVSKAFTLAGGELSLRLNLNNLLNEQYEIVLGYPMPGLGAMLTATYSF